jgi:hypothetical protein
MRRLISLAFIAALLSVAFSLPAQVMCDKSQLCPAGGGGGSFSHVEDCTNSTASTGVTSVGCTFSANLTSGDLLRICVAHITSATVTWSGDSGTFVQDVSNVYDGGTENFYTSCAYVLSLGGGAATITATFSVSVTYSRIHGGEWMPPAGVAIDQAPGTIKGSAATTTATSNSITTTASGDLVVSDVWTAGGSAVTITANSPFTLYAYDSANSNAQEAYVQPSAGATNGTFGLSPAEGWDCFIVSFKP